MLLTAVLLALILPALAIRGVVSILKSPWRPLAARGDARSGSAVLDVRVEPQVYEPDFMLERCTRVSAVSARPVKLDLLARRPALFAGASHLPEAGAVFALHLPGDVRIDVEATDEALARSFLSGDVERALRHLPPGAALRYTDGVVTLLLPGPTRPERDRDAAIAIVSATAAAGLDLWSPGGYRG